MSGPIKTGDRATLIAGAMNYDKKQQLATAVARDVDVRYREYA